MATIKDCQTLTSYYIKKYKERYKSEPNVNRFSARWGFDLVLSGMSIPLAKELLDYYFTTPPTRRHDLNWFFQNYEKILVAYQNGKTDAEHRRKLMEESKIRAEQWRQSGKQGIADNQRSSKE